MSRVNRIAVALIPLIFSIPSPALAVDALNGWRNVRWGMTEAQVRKAEKTLRLEREESEAGAFLKFKGISISEVAFNGSFRFNAGKLTGVTLIRTDTGEEAERLFGKVLGTLENKYGAALKGKRSDLETIPGMLAREVTWRSGQTLIELNLFGLAKEASVLISYSPIDSADPNL